MMLRATVVNCSSSWWIAAIWISFSRATAFSGNVALSNTSESRSTPNFTSGFMTSTDTLKLLLPASLETEPPTASISLAICSAVRVLVPFNSTLAIKRVMPFVCGVSFFGFGFARQRTLWIQRDDGQIVLGQIARGDAFDVIERHFLDSIEIMPAEIQIAREQPVRPNVRGLATHGRKRSEVVTERNFPRLFQFLCRDAGLFHFVNNSQG